MGKSYLNNFFYTYTAKAVLLCAHSKKMLFLFISLFVFQFSVTAQTKIKQLNLTETCGLDRIDPVKNRNHTFYLPFPEAHLYDAFRAAANCPTNITSTIRSVVTIKTPYPGTIIAYDHWEDGFEAEPNNPIQLTTETWSDGNLFN